jgi:putative transposase
MMVTYIDENKEKHGVGSICRVLPIARSTYYDHKSKQHEPARLSARAKREDILKVDIQRIWEENFRVYGVRKVWRPLNREDISVARWTVERLTKKQGLRGVVCGRRIRTILSDHLAERPLDLVDRDFKVTRPNALWVVELTYVATWHGFVYVAFIIDAFACRIVCWRVSTSLRADIALDALEQVRHDRQMGEQDQLIHHSDRGVQCVAIR